MASKKAKTTATPKKAARADKSLFETAVVLVKTMTNDERIALMKAIQAAMGGERLYTHTEMRAAVAHELQRRANAQRSADEIARMNAMLRTIQR